MINPFYIIPRIGGVAYLNVAKAASTSISFALSQMRHRDGVDLPKRSLPDGSSPIHGFSPPYAHMEYFFSRWPADFPPLPNSLIKFSFVRNPYDRFYSFYVSKIVNRQTPSEYYEKYGIQKGCSFEDCVEIVTSLDPKELEQHAAPQSMILCNENAIIVDFVGKVENLDLDWPVIKKITGFDLELGISNRTKNDQTPVYTYEMRDRIFEYYRDDFDMFGYAKDATLIDNSSKLKQFNKQIFTGHLRVKEENQKIQSIIYEKTKMIRSLSKAFEDYPEKRTDFFQNQEELFNEMIMKKYFYLNDRLSNLSKVWDELYTLRRNVWKTVEGHGKSLGQLQKNISRVQKGIENFNRTLNINLLSNYLTSRKSIWKRLLRWLHYRMQRESRILHKGSLVDADYYFRSYPEVKESGLSAITHYVRFGVQEGRNPSEHFDTLKYLCEHPELIPKGINPLVHFYLKH